MTHTRKHGLPHPGGVPSRRTVLRTALWSVPAVHLAAAAPAFATSGDALALAPAPSGQWTVGGWFSQYMTGSVSVKNPSTTRTMQLRLTVTLPNAYVYTTINTNATVFVSNVSGGWTAGAVSYTGSGSSRTGSFVLTAGTQLAGGATSTATFRVNLVGRLVSNFLDPVTVAATALRHTQTSGSFIPVPD